MQKEEINIKFSLIIKNTLQFYVAHYKQHQNIFIIQVYHNHLTDFVAKS